ncbi:MAG: Ig-like domain-containing protein [Prevotellaceae bacterium]|jgi:sialate O-acetylesterase|nr:Ig-like domain-containing protein [Prevotellaceae bacterium]
MKRFFLLGVACLFVLPAFLQAKVVLPEIMSDNMVLQQNTQVKLWGKAAAGSTVSVKASWNAQTFTVKAANDGKFLIQVPTPAATFTPQTVSFTDGSESVTLKNILIGEVWVASGQSNMEMPLDGFFSSPVVGAEEAITTSGKYKGVRFVKVPRTSALTPQETVKGKWKTSEPANAPMFSAVAFFYATYLTELLNVPIGIIECNWGGATVEGYMPEWILKTYPDVDLSQAGRPDSRELPEYMQPMIMYNGMLKPIENYTIKGFIWYQGESNIGRPDYALRLAKMVEIWRNEWGLGELPFYSVEIAPYTGYGQGISGALLREEQYKSMSIISNSLMVSTNDLVEPFEAMDIHPRHKKEVGQRLGAAAAVNTYGIQGIADRGPVFKSMEIRDNRVMLQFDNVPQGFYYDTDIEGFEVAGPDKIFYPAQVSANWPTVSVYSRRVANPVAVRYGFKNYQPGTLKNSRGWPAYPFRTDDWKDEPRNRQR